MEGPRVEIKALGKWSVRQGGRLVATGSNQRVILHALVLGRGKVDRGDLELLLPNHDQSRERRQAAIRNTLTYLRKLPLDISYGDNPVAMSAAPSQVSIDLWEFFAHVAFDRLDAAYEMIAGGQEPYLLANDEDPGNPIWRQTLADFRAAKARIVAAMSAASGARSMLVVRQRLLARSLVPGVGRQVPIQEVRDRLETLAVPWHAERPRGASGDERLPVHLTRILASGRRDVPRQVVLVGGAGTGKTVAAISTFLRLTDGSEGANPARPPRTVLYVDADAEASQPGFGGDGWFEQRLAHAQSAGAGRPIVIMVNADAYLARRQHGLVAALDARVFRDADVLLCCGEQLYEKRLRYSEFGTHVIRLRPWRRELQESFARAMFGERVCHAFEAWIERDPAREQLCAVPLHLVHVLSRIAEDPGALAGISKPWQLFEEVARVRLRVTGPRYDEEELFQDLASLAHRYFVEATSSTVPVRFNVEDLRQHLLARGRGAVNRRADALVGGTLLTSPAPSRGELRFESPAWDCFFVARHLVHTLLYRPRETLVAFSKFLSADIMELCEEMLREALDRHAEPIRAALRRALEDGQATALSPGRRTVAREQVGYLLGALADQRTREHLAALVAPDSPTHEPDHAVRRGIVFGLANGGAAQVADLYVERLRQERERSESTPERDANIGFLLSFHGDQPFDPEGAGSAGMLAPPVRTVAELVRGLEETRHLGGWRIKLYSLSDLAMHPAVPHDRFSGVLQPHLDRLRAVIRRLEQDPERRSWPELADLRRLVANGSTACSPGASRRMPEEGLEPPTRGL